MTRKLNKTWANAEPLSRYFERLISETDFDATAYQKSTEGHATDNPTMQVLSNLTNAWNHSNLTRDHKNAATIILQNRLVGEDINMVGRLPTSDGNFEYVQLEYEFWIGAKIWPEIDEAQSGELKVDQLRVVSSEMKSDANLSAIVQQKFKRVPPPKILRPQAIGSCFELKAIDFDDMSLFDRIVIYEEWILAAYEIDELGPSNFGYKSWEADETKFKKNNGLINPKT